MKVPTNCIHGPIKKLLILKHIIINDHFLILEPKTVDKTLKFTSKDGNSTSKGGVI